METPRILIQLDGDSQPSVFDAIVAIDSGIDQLLQYSRVEPTNARDLVHGAMFTRGPDQLKHTAIFIGGANVAVGEAIGEEIKQTFFGPIRVSVMLDSNGSNTTSAAAVLCAARHLELPSVQALLLGGTGPVGQRVARLLLGQGGKVYLASRERSRATAACRQISNRLGDQGDRLVPVEASPHEISQLLAGPINAVFGCGAAGSQLLSAAELKSAAHLRVAIDLNAVPPEGLEGIAVTDKAVKRDQRIDYGAIGVGGLKMKIHREALRTLFTRNDLMLDAEEIFQIGQELESANTV